MKIAELFVELGFVAKGDDKLVEFDKSLTRIAGDAAVVLGSLAAVTASMAALVHETMRATVEFKAFDLQTGLSADNLRAWQHFGAANDVGGEEIASTIKGIQTAAAEIKLGRGNVAPWQLLGISPQTDPFEVLEQLRQKAKELPPDIARVIMAQMGISDNVFQMLRQTNTEFAKIRRQYLLTKQEQANIVGLNRAWKEMLFSISATRDRLVSAFAPALRGIVGILKAVLDQGARLIDWLNGTSWAAQWLRNGIIVLVLGFVALTIAGGLLASAIGAASIAMKGFLLFATPAMGMITAVTAGLAALAAIIAATVLLYQDLWVSASGGKSLFPFASPIAEGLRLQAVLEELIGLFAKLTGRQKEADFWFKRADQDREAAWKVSHPGEKTPPASEFKIQNQRDPASNMLWEFGFVKGLIAAYTSSAATPPTPAGAHTSSVRQENNVQIHVNGGDTPNETGQAVAGSVKAELIAAAYQLPIASY